MKLADDCFWQISTPFGRRHRRMFLGLAVMVAASRFIIGAHYLGDVLLGCAVGLAIVVLIQTLFYQCGIYLGSQGSTEQ
jgi:membrane-associated phospholipid phosphatase